MLGKQHHRLLPVPFENRIGVVLPLAFINKRDRGTATIESRVNRMPVLILLANIMEHADDVRRFRASPRQAILLCEFYQRDGHIQTVLEQTALVCSMVFGAGRGRKEAASFQPLNDALRKQMQSRLHATAKSENATFNIAMV